MDVGPAPHSEGTRDLLNFVVVVVCFPFHTHWVTGIRLTLSLSAEMCTRLVTECTSFSVFLRINLSYRTRLSLVMFTIAPKRIWPYLGCSAAISCTDKVSGGAGWIMEPQHWYGQGQKTTWLCCACTNNRRLFVVAVAPWCLNYVKLCCGSVCFAYCLLSVYLVQDAALHLTL